MRYPEFLRASVLLFAAAGTALAVAALAGANAHGDTALLAVALGWWTLAAMLGLVLGRQPSAFAGIRRQLASARAATALPELEPAALLFNRLWPLAAVTVISGVLAFVVPQVPAIAAGYALLCALWWRRQSAAVTAIEERDGVQFFVERSSPFRPTQLLRTPGLRRFEPTERREGTGLPA